jgi:hypothetical protein
MIVRMTLLLIGLLASSCWHGAQPFPRWLTHPPVDPEYLYAIGLAEASDPALAYLIASTRARGKLVRMMEIHVDTEETRGSSRRTCRGTNRNLWQ